MTGISLAVARAILNDLAQTGATRFAWAEEGEPGITIKADVPFRLLLEGFKGAGVCPDGVIRPYGFLRTTRPGESTVPVLALAEACDLAEKAGEETLLLDGQTIDVGHLGDWSRLPGDRACRVLTVWGGRATIESGCLRFTLDVPKEDTNEEVRP